jgi:hypothetical protein
MISGSSLVRQACTREWYSFATHLRRPQQLDLLVRLLEVLRGADITNQVVVVDLEGDGSWSFRVEDP